MRRKISETFKLIFLKLNYYKPQMAHSRYSVLFLGQEEIFPIELEIVEVASIVFGTRITRRGQQQGRQFLLQPKL